MTLLYEIFGAVKLVKNADFDKYKYCGYSIGFDVHGIFPMLRGGFGKNLIIFDADISSYSYVHNKKKDILILGEGPTQGLEDTILTAKKKYSINFSEQIFVSHGQNLSNLEL